MKKKQPKYYVAQVGGAAEDIDIPAYTKMQSPVMPVYKTPAEQLGNTTFVPQTTPPGYAVKPGKNKFTKEDGLNLFNGVAQGVTAVANAVNDQQAAHNEQMQYLNKAIMPTSYQNMERYSLNTNPAYMQMGGNAFAGKYVLPTPDNAEQIANPSNQTPDQLAKLRMSELISQGVNHPGNYATTPDGKFLFNQMSTQYGQAHAQKMFSDMALFKQDPSYMKQSPEQRAQAYIKFGDPSLASFKQQMNSFGYGAGDTYRNTSQVMGEKQQGTGYLATKQAGGDVGTIAGGHPSNANVEAEKGEVVQQANGSISQVDPNGNTHEQGGEYLPAVHRVLENTSNLRDDKNSKYLKLEPAQLKGLLGLDTNKSMSHAEALVKANEMLEEQRNKIVRNMALSTKGRQTLDRYGENSSKLNIEHFKSLPTKQELFERLFSHQEHIKALTGITDEGAQAKYGGLPKMQLGGFAGSKLKLKTPGGHSDAFPSDMKFEDYLKALKDSGFKYEGINDNKALQKGLYDYKLKNGEFEDIRNMWSEGMHLDGMQKAIDMGLVYAKDEGIHKKGQFKDGVLNNDENLKKLGDLYPDGKLGPRLLKLAKATPPRIWADDPAAPAAPAKVEPTVATGITNNVNATPQKQSKFNEPLRWFDVASPIGSFLNSDRLSEKYNPAELHQLQLKLQDPTAALNQNQADFNSAIQAVQNTTPQNAGVQLSNLANLTSRKYALNNQVLGNTENQNSQIKNQEIMYNTAVRDKQSVSDQQSREVFEEKVLKSKALQQEQKLTSLDALYKTIAENRALNRNGNLIMKFSKAFDQYGDYNGYQTKFAPDPRLGMQNDPQYNIPQAAGAAKPTSAGGLQGLQPGKNYYNRKTGKTLRFDGSNLTELK